MSLIRVPAVRRIEVQGAMFLKGSHADLIEQYVGEIVAFRQVDGLVFESPLRGISEVGLLSVDDPVAEFTRAWAEAYDRLPPRPGSAWPPVPSSPRLAPESYRELADAWFRRHRPSYELDAETSTMLDRLCEFHAAIQHPHHRIPAYDRGLHRFLYAVGEIQTLRSVKEIIRFNYQFIRGEQLRGVLLELGWDWPHDEGRD
jgi:hypothetical protein